MRLLINTVELTFFKSEFQYVYTENLFNAFFSLSSTKKVFYFRHDNLPRRKSFKRMFRILYVSCHSVVAKYLCKDSVIS